MSAAMLASGSADAAVGAAGAIPTLPSVVAAFGVSFVGTLFFRRALVAASMIDVPNERSSHSVPTPRGGGVVFVAVVLLAMILAIVGGVLPARDAAAIAGILGVAAIGFLDDRRSVGAAPRLAVHMAGAALVTWSATHGALAGLAASWAESLGLADSALAPLLSTATVLALALASAWLVNLVNFMDGIDGLAAGEGAFVLAAAAMLATGGGDERTLALAAAAAVAGFGLVNASRWRIFMGDAGSGALGLLLAWVLMLLASRAGLAPLAAIALPAVFVADATTTLAIRVWRGEHPARAHRTHAYQRVAGLGWPHLVVTGLYLGVNLLVVLPVAWHAQRGGAGSPVLVGAMYAALVAAACLLGAGREPKAAAQASSKPG